MRRSIIVVAIATGCGSMAHAQAVPAEATLAEERARAVQCLALAIGYEAGYESLAGQKAVAEVVLNRVRHSAYPNSVCGVVFQGSTRRTGCQFTFTCDGSMLRPLAAKVQIASRKIAEDAIDGRNLPQVSGATHYHANYVSPYWAPSLVKIGSIGAHIFYRMPGASDISSGAYRLVAGREPIVGTPAPVSAKPAAATSAPVAAQPFAPWGLAL